MDDCIFCRIIAGTIPASTVYEDERTSAFLDIRPNNKGHVLVVPKTHHADVHTIPENDLCAVARTGKRIADVLRKAVGAEGVNLIMNNGAAAGQIVFHAHLHVIPRFAGDNVFSPPRRLSYDDGEDAQIAENIANALKK